MGKRSIGIKYYFLQGINPAIRFLILSDIMVVGAAGMLGPIFALFIEGFIKGGNEAVAGAAAAIFLVTKSLFQVPIATLIDRVRGEKDDYWFMVVFSVLTALVPLLYLAISQPWHLYLVQFILGVFTAMTFPSYMAIFTRHIDAQKEGTEWGVYFTLTDLSSAILAAVGGYVASANGFPILISIVVIISTLGALALIPIKPYLRRA